MASDLLGIIDRHVEAFVERLAETEEQKIKMLEIWRGGRRPGLSASPAEQKTPCRHKMLSGKNIGRTCGRPASAKSIAGAYCSAHLKHEVVPAKAKAPRDLDPQLVKTVMDRARIILFRTIGGHLVDPNTQLIFDAKRLVVGKEVFGKVCALTPADLDFCARQLIEVKPGS